MTYAPIRGGDQTGFALLIVLWVTVLLSMLAAAFAYSMRTETVLTDNLLERARAGQLADAGIRIGILQLLSPASLPGRSPFSWRADGTLHKFAFDSGSVLVDIQAETGKIDINLAPEALLRGLGAAIGARDPQRLAARILDWRDTDHLRWENGAEDADYEAAAATLGAGDRPFLSTVELGQVLEVEQDAVAAMQPLVTVFSGNARVDPVTARREVLYAIPGLSRELIDRYVEEREQLAQQGFPPPVHLLGAGWSHLLPGGRPSSRSGEYANQGLFYTVEAEGITRSGVRVRKHAVVELAGNPSVPYQVLAWSEEPWREPTRPEPEPP